MTPSPVPSSTPLVSPTTGASPTAAPTEVPTIQREFTADELGLSLGPQGRPYEVSVVWDRVVRRSIGTLVVPDGTLVVMDGIAAAVDGQGDATEVDFGAGVQALDVTVVRTVSRRDGEVERSVLGVRLDVRDTTVARWGPFEPGYSTDGGLGAVLASTLVEVRAGDRAQLDTNASISPGRPR